MSNFDHFLEVTELAGDEVAEEQIERLCHRYYWAGSYCEGKDVLEVACGTGQGLGYLSSNSASVVGADLSNEMLERANNHYGSRIKTMCFDAQKIPYEDESLDVVIIFEALYYVPSPEAFFSECARVLKPGGYLLISTANKDLYDFNPSPHSHVYFGAGDLTEALNVFGFESMLFGHLSVTAISGRQRLLRSIKKLVVSLGLMPKTMRGKKLLKKIVFGSLQKMPHEIDEDTTGYEPPTKILPKADHQHKVIYCAAMKNITQGKNHE